MASRKRGPLSDEELSKQLFGAGDAFLMAKPHYYERAAALAEKKSEEWAEQAAVQIVKAYIRRRKDS